MVRNEGFRGVLMLSNIDYYNVLRIKVVVKSLLNILKSCISKLPAKLDSYKYARVLHYKLYFFKLYNSCLYLKISEIISE